MSIAFLACLLILFGPAGIGAPIAYAMLVGAIVYLGVKGQYLRLAAKLTGIPLHAIIREIWLFIGVLLIALFAMLLVPEIVLWLPRQFGYRG